MQKEISVIVPIHNDADVISGTIDSILDFFNKENSNFFSVNIFL